MRICKARYSCRLDQYNISEEDGEVVLKIKNDHEFIIESAIDIGIMYARISGKNVSVLSEKYKPIKIKPDTTADDVIAEFYTNNKKVYCMETITLVQNNVQKYLKA